MDAGDTACSVRFSQPGYGYVLFSRQDRVTAFPGIDSYHADTVTRARDRRQEDQKKPFTVIQEKNRYPG